MTEPTDERAKLLPLPCPCCGKPAAIWAQCAFAGTIMDGYVVRCEKRTRQSDPGPGCELTTPLYPTREEAVAAWNRRATPPAAPVPWASVCLHPETNRRCCSCGAEVLDIKMTGGQPQPAGEEAVDIPKLARRMYDIEHEGYTYNDIVTPDNEFASRRHFYERMARAAIAAMRAGRE